MKAVQKAEEEAAEEAAEVAAQEAAEVAAQKAAEEKEAAQKAAEEMEEQRERTEEITEILVKREFMKSRLNDLDYDDHLDNQKQDFVLELGRLTDQLTEFIPVYEEKYGALMFQGKRYMEVIQDDHRRVAEEEAAEKIRRDQAGEEARQQRVREAAAQQRVQEEPLIELVSRREFMKFRLNETAGSPMVSIYMQAFMCG